MMAYTSTCDPDCQVILDSIDSRMISGHQKLLACWVHSGWGDIFNHTEGSKCIARVAVSDLL